MRYNEEIISKAAYYTIAIGIVSTVTVVGILLCVSKFVRLNFNNIAATLALPVILLFAGTVLLFSPKVYAYLRYITLLWKVINLRAFQSKLYLT